jgi:hypothetical protein
MGNYLKWELPMKCPKCGYNSFECNDICAKCSHDLTAHKMTFGLKPVVFQKETRIIMAAALAAETAAAATPEQPVEQPADLFSFDLPEEETAASSPPEATREDFFSFTEKPETPAPVILDAFTFDDDQAMDTNNSPDLFDNTPESPEQESMTQSADPEVTFSTPEQTATPGEYDLTNFSWDDTPEETVSGVKKPVDDFDSLFGDIEDSIKK